MGFIELLVVAIGFSMDAFAVAVCKGLAMKKASVKAGLICGAWFGGFQALMPLIGFFIGALFATAIQAVDHWIAFGLLAIIGGSMLKEGFEKDIYKNTYIAYNSLRIVGDTAIISNGSHTDVIADKISLGMNLKDALAYSLLTMDYEKDDYNTPRIAGVVKSSDKEDEYGCFIGIVNDKKLLVEEVPYGDAAFISTYGSQAPDPVDFSAKTATEAAKFIFDEGTFANYEKPVTSCATVFDGEWQSMSIIHNFFYFFL